MSQHVLLTEKYFVCLGYDRPLDYVFCTIVARSDNEIAYSNLSDPCAGTEQQDVEYYRPIIESFEITVPQAMFDEVKADQRDRVGNRVVEYQS